MINLIEGLSKTQLQRDHLNMMISFFEKLRVIYVNGADVTARMNFINRWLIAINVLFMLWDSLKRDSNDKDFVLCRYFPYKSR